MKSLRSKTILSTLFLILSSTFFPQELDLSPEQLAMLETLPPDQRANILEKMTTASALQGQIEEAFEEVISLVEKPELRDFEDEADYCSDCIYGFNFFQFSPSTFAPADDTPVNSSYSVGPGDKLLVSFYGGNENAEFNLT